MEQNSGQPVIKSNNKKYYITGAFLIALIISFILGRVSVPKIIPQTSQDSSQLQANKTINKSFLFSVKNDSGVEITKLKYLVESASLQQTVIIKGQAATVVNGKVFLVVNIKLTNDYNKNIQINSRDYIRLSTGNNTEFNAPDLYNDPIEVDAISSKETRIGFAIDKNAKDIALHIGEIDGNKTVIPLDFTKK